MGVFQKSIPSSKGGDLTGMFRWIGSMKPWKSTPWNIRSDRAANKLTAAPARSTGSRHRLYFCKNRSTTSQMVWGWRIFPQNRRDDFPNREKVLDSKVQWGGRWGVSACGCLVLSTAQSHTSQLGTWMATVSKWRAANVITRVPRRLSNPWHSPK